VNPEVSQRGPRSVRDDCRFAMRWLAWNAFSGLVAMGCSTYGLFMTPEEWLLAVGPAPRRGDKRIAREATEGIRQIESFLGAAPLVPPKMVRPTEAQRATRRDPRGHETS
jgi:hypothetical protein